MESYDNSKPSKYIMYLDAYNLYGWVNILLTVNLNG